MLHQYLTLQDDYYASYNIIETDKLDENFWNKITPYLESGWKIDKIVEMEQYEKNKKKYYILKKEFNLELI